MLYTITVHSYNVNSLGLIKEEVSNLMLSCTLPDCKRVYYYFYADSISVNGVQMKYSNRKYETKLLNKVFKARVLT